MGYELCAKAKLGRVRGVSMRFMLFLLLALPLSANSADSESYSRFETTVLRDGLEQAEKISGYWDPSQRDCSGLVRFLYRRALGTSLKGWFHSDGKRHPYASAEDLVHWNFRFLRNDVNTDFLKTGDLLVFYSEDKSPENRFHLMMVLKSPYRSGSEALLLYHNGAKGKDGAVRKVSLRDLRANLAGEWAPALANPRFRGVYRWKGWSDQ
jgi:uncharacterized protein YfaT (DUF1175 family)